MTILLEGDGSTTIDRRPVTVAVTGLPPSAFRLVAMDAEREAFGVIRQRPGVMVLPRVDRALTVRLVPEQAAAFAAGTVLGVRITTEATSDSAGDDVVVQAVDVSGLPVRDVVVIDVVDAQRLSVTANRVVRDEALGLLAGKARAAARAHMREATPEPVHVLIAVDMSASMAEALARHGVEAVIDVVAGLSQVVGAGRELEVCLLAGRPVPVPEVGIRELASATRSAIDRAGLGCGFRSAPPDLPVRPASLTYVVTDAVPADVAALRAANRPGDARHLVIVGDAGEPDPPEARGLPITRLQQAPADLDTSTQLLDDQSQLVELVGSLLSGLRP